MAGQVIIKRYELWIAIVTLIGTLALAGVALVKQFQTSDSLKNISVKIEDSEDLRKIIQKPLEGVWRYNMAYDSFHSKAERWNALGRAIFLWKQGNKYEVYIGASLFELNAGNGEQIVTWFLRGDLPASLEGYPSAPFSLTVEYMGRTSSRPEFKSAKVTTSTFIEMEITKMSKDGNALEISGKYKSRKTSGVLTLTKIN